MAQIRVKELRFVAPAELASDERNWRKHPQAQRDALQAMVDAVGIVDALIARETPEGLALIDGHLRRDMLDVQELPVIIVDLDEDEAGQVLATLDPIAAMAKTNQDALQELVDRVKPPIDWGRVMPRINAPEVGQDDTPLLDEDGEPETKRGDVWILGQHRLMCGDSTDPSDVDKLLHGEKPRLMVTDPPYGVNYDPNWRNEVDRDNGRPYGARAIGTPSNDHVSDWSPAYKLFPGDVVYLWHPPGATGLVFMTTIRDLGFDIRMIIVWAKSSAPIGRGRYHVQHEPLIYAVRAGSTDGWIGDAKATTLWDIPKPSKSETGLSVQKPVECMERPIRNHEGDVYDPFVGSGTTIIAAERQGRACYAMEIEPRYVDMARKRWEAYTGQTAVLEQADG